MGFDFEIPNCRDGLTEPLLATIQQPNKQPTNGSSSAAK
jgi:hypothetical protein